ncbi:MAG TPA: LuxR C-terminal-related transcriptional regulator [Tepidiformaceae bacterium]
MTRLRQSDLEAILSFLADAGQVEFDHPYPLDFLARLRDLVPCDAITYQELDPHQQRFYSMVEFPSETESTEGDEDAYWRVAPCPTLDFRERTGRLDAVRTSDLIDRRRYRNLPIFQEYFRPAGVEHIIDLGLPAPHPQIRSFVLFREVGASDFSERDRDVLEALRPHLYQLEAHAALRRRLVEALAEHDGDRDGGICAGLTPREREVVELLAEGMTNAEIAATLWVAPSTVKKHLENVYAKTGVGRRAALVAARHALPG